MTARHTLAMVLTAPGQLEPMDLPIPAPAASTALLRIEVCGICGTALLDGAVSYHLTSYAKVAAPWEMTTAPVWVSACTMALPASDFQILLTMVSPNQT